MAETPAEKQLNDFKNEVRDAKRLLEFAVSERATAQPDQPPIDDDLVLAIKEAEDCLSWEKLPDAKKRAEFERSYRDLSRLMAPVTARSLRDTEVGADGPAKQWARRLGWYTGFFLLIVIVAQNGDAILGDYFPLDEESSGVLMFWSVVFAFMHSISPFAFGGLGACAFLLRACAQHIYKRQFNADRRTEYHNRILLGVVSGGAIPLLVEQITVQDVGTVNISEATLGFIAGYSTDFVFQAVERLAAAILPKVGIETAKRRDVEPPEKEMTERLLDRLRTATDEDERKLIKDTVKRLHE